jgi:hypothetical protein
VSDVVAGHPSLRRDIRIVLLGRIGADSVDALIARGEANTGVRFDTDARAMIADAACGSPYHLRMLAGHSRLPLSAVGRMSSPRRIPASASSMRSATGRR